MENIVSAYKNFISTFSKEASLEWYKDNMHRPELGVYAEKRGKFSFRATDDTPSVAIYEGLRWVDFGGDARSNEPVNRIMEVTGMSFIEAVKTFMSWNGQDIEQYSNNSFKPVLKKEEKKKVAPYKSSYIRMVIQNRIRYKKSYDILKKELFRGCSTKEAKFAERVLHIGYLPKSEEWVDRIFIPEMSIDFVPYGSYRYNRAEGKKGGAKGLLRKNSKRVLFPEHLIPKFSKYILYVEGHSDCVINIAKGLSCITTGSSTKKFGDNISKLKGKILYDFPDLDLPGLKGAMSRHMEILEYNQSCASEDKIKHIIFWWADWFRSEKIFDKIKNNDVLKSDLFYGFKIPVKDNFAYFNLNLLENIQRNICQKQKWEFNDKISVKNWHVVFKNGYRQEGFDFADLYEEEDSIEKNMLLSFIKERVKFSI